MDHMLCVFTIVTIAVASPIAKRTPLYPDKINTSEPYSENDIEDLKEYEETSSSTPEKRQVLGFGYENNHGIVSGNQINYQRFNYQDAIVNINTPKYVESQTYRNNYRNVFSEHDAQPQQFTPFNAHTSTYHQNYVRQAHNQNSEHVHTSGQGKFSSPEQENIFYNYRDIIPYNYDLSKNVRLENPDNYAGRRPTHNENIYLNPAEETPNYLKVDNSLVRSVFRSHHPGNAASYTSISQHERPASHSLPPIGPGTFTKFNHFGNIGTASPENVFLVRNNVHNVIKTSQAPTQNNTPILLLLPPQVVPNSNTKQATQTARNQESGFVPSKYVGYTAEYSENVRPLESQPIGNTGGLENKYSSPGFPGGALAIQLVAADGRHHGQGHSVVVIDRTAPTTYPTSPFYSGNIVQGARVNADHASGVVPNHFYQQHAVTPFALSPSAYELVSSGHAGPVRPHSPAPQVLIVASHGAVDENHDYRVQSAVLVNTGSANSSSRSRNPANFGSNHGLHHYVSNVGHVPGILPGTLVLADHRSPHNIENGYEHTHVSPYRFPPASGYDTYNRNTINEAPFFYNEPVRFLPYNHGHFSYNPIHQEPVQIFNSASLTPQYQGGIPNNLNNLVLLYSNIPVDIAQVTHGKSFKQNSSEAHNTGNAMYNKSHASNLADDILVGKVYLGNKSESSNHVLKSVRGNTSGGDSILKMSESNSEYESHDSYNQESPSNQQIIFGKISHKPNSNLESHENTKPIFKTKKSILCSKGNGKVSSRNCDALGSKFATEENSHKGDMIIGYGEKL